MDINCVVCGEPWDSWGVNHGDMLAWETDLFRKGAGCPSCEGVSNGYEPSSLSDFENGDEDPMDRISARENFQEGKSPKWEKPENEVLHACDGCGVELVRLISEEVYNGSERKKIYDWNMPFRAPGYKWYHSHSFRNVDAADYIEGGREWWNWHPWDDKRSACPRCVQSCDNCGEVIIAKVDGLMPDDCYDPGYSFASPDNHNDSLCVICFSEYCSECESNPCECSSHDDSDDDEEEEDS